MANETQSGTTIMNLNTGTWNTAKDGGYIVASKAGGTYKVPLSELNGSIPTKTSDLTNDSGFLTVTVWKNIMNQFLNKGNMSANYCKAIENESFGIVIVTIDCAFNNASTNTDIFEVPERLKTNYIVVCGVGSDDGSIVMCSYRYSDGIIYCSGGNQTRKKCYNGSVMFLKK